MDRSVIARPGDQAAVACYGESLEKNWHDREIPHLLAIGSDDSCLAAAGNRYELVGGPESFQACYFFAKTFDILPAFAGLWIPDFYDAFRARGRERAAVRQPGNIEHMLCMALQVHARTVARKGSDACE